MKIPEFYGDQVFLFSWWRILNFLNFMKTRPNRTNATLREAWPWHSSSKTCKTTAKIGLKFCKLSFFMGVWSNSLLQVFLHTSETKYFEKVLNAGKVYLVEKELFQMQASEVFCKKAVHRNFVKFTGNTYARVSF